MSFLQRKLGSTTEHFVVAHFDAYLDGTLAKTERSVYEQHLDGCQECRNWVARQENLMSRLETEIPPAEALGPAAAARIQQDLYHAMRRAVIMNNVRGIVAGAGALVLLIVAVGVIVLWQSGGVPPTTEIGASQEEAAAEESMPAEGAPLLNADVAQELDRLLNAFQENGLFNGAVLVARGNETILSKGYGMADAVKEIANTPQTRYRIGHITQAFTTVAILQLQEQGRLTVDDSICQYLDACPPAWEAVTIHHLMTHSSGIADYVLERGPLSEGSTPEQLVSRVIDLPLKFEPGSQDGFSNSGFVILGMIIERVSGQSYLAFLQENIFDPLGMADTGLDAAAGELAVGYSYGSREADEVDIAPLFATASLYSTVEDLYRFSQALQTEQLISQQSLDQMLAVRGTPFEQYPALGPLSGDWAGGTLDGRQVFFTGGQEDSGRDHVDGFQSILAFYPDDDLTILILENLDIADPTAVLQKVASTVLGDA
jgi:CubicO group peptidase (beta-lactamase class C family)